MCLMPKQKLNLIQTDSNAIVKDQIVHEDQLYHQNPAQEEWEKLDFDTKGVMHKENKIVPFIFYIMWGCTSTF